MVPDMCVWICRSQGGRVASKCRGSCESIQTSSIIFCGDWLIRHFRSLSAQLFTIPPHLVAYIIPPNYRRPGCHPPPPHSPLTFHLLATRAPRRPLGTPRGGTAAYDFTQARHLTIPFLGLPSALRRLLTSLGGSPRQGQ